MNFASEAKRAAGTARTISVLARRNLLLYFKDKMAVFFSMLAPLIILMLYLLFLGDLQMEAVENSLPEFFIVPEKGVRALVDSWMMAGVLAVSCITVAFTANTVMVSDRNRGILNDAIAAPVPISAVRAAYFIADFAVTAAIALLIYCICLIYLGATGEFHLSVADGFEEIGILLLSALSATALSTLVCSLFRTEGALSGFIGILSAAIGFLIGAYMPVTTFPLGVQYATAILPGSYSGGLMRNAMMRGALDYLVSDMPEAFRGQLRGELAKTYSLEINFFGLSTPVWGMYLALALSVLLFVGLMLLPQPKFRPHFQKTKGEVEKK